MYAVILNYTLVFIAVSIALLLSVIVARFLVHRFPKTSTPKVRLLFFLIGCGALLIAAIGRLGWSIQTMSGESLAEKIDIAVFTFLSISGTFLLIVDYCIGFFKTTDIYKKC